MAATARPSENWTIPIFGPPQSPPRPFDVFGPGMDLPTVAPSLPTIFGPYGKPTDLMNPRVGGVWGDPRDGGRRSHQGLDVVANRASDTTLGNAVAIADGIVTQVGNHGGRGYGQFVEVTHLDGSKSRYAHLDGSPYVNTGDRVQMGDALASLGNTGGSTGAHLHFEMFDASGRKVDPQTMGYGIEATPGRKLGGLSAPIGLEPGVIDNVRDYSDAMDGRPNFEVPTPIAKPFMDGVQMAEGPWTHQKNNIRALDEAKRQASSFSMGAPQTGGPLAFADEQTGFTSQPLDAQMAAQQAVPDQALDPNHSAVSPPTPTPSPATPSRFDQAFADAQAGTPSATPAPTSIGGLFASDDVPSPAVAPVDPMLSSQRFDQAFVDAQTASPPNLDQLAFDRAFETVPTTDPALTAELGGLFASGAVPSATGQTPTVSVPQNIQIASAAPVPMARPSPPPAPVPTPRPSAPIPTPNPLNVQNPVTSVVMGSAPPTVAVPGAQQAVAAPPTGSTPTVSGPSPGLPHTNEPGFVQGLAPSLVERAKAMGIEAPEGQVIGYSPLGGFVGVNPDAGPAATGPGIFGFMERDFGFGGSGDRMLANAAARTPGRVGGAMLGGAFGTAVGGPIGGLLGGLFGGWAGGRATQYGANALANQYSLGPIEPSDSGSGLSEASRNEVSGYESQGLGGLW